MQTRFQIREIDLSKGYCLVVTDKNHAQVTFGFDDLEEQMARLEQFLVYSDDSEREIATVNLLVARNTPVTFAQPAAEVIGQIEPPKSITTKTTPNETRSEEGEPEIRKARPVQSATPIPVRKALPYSPGVKKFHANPASLPVRKAIPLQRFKQEGKPNG